MLKMAAYAPKVARCPSRIAKSYKLKGRLAHQLLQCDQNTTDVPICAVHVVAGRGAQKHGQCGRLFAQAFFDLEKAQLDQLSDF